MSRIGKNDLPEGAMRQEDIDKVRVPGRNSAWKRLDFRSFIIRPEESEEDLEKRILAEAEEACFDYPRAGWATGLQRPVYRPRDAEADRYLTDCEKRGIFTFGTKVFDMKKRPLVVEPRTSSKTVIAFNKSYLPKQFHKAYTEAYYFTRYFLEDRYIDVRGEVETYYRDVVLFTCDPNNRVVKKRFPHVVHISRRAEKKSVKEIDPYDMTLFYDPEKDRSICQFTQHILGMHTGENKIDLFCHQKDGSIKHVPVLEVKYM